MHIVAIGVISTVYACFVAAAFRCFEVNDPSSQRSKVFVSVGGGATIATIIWSAISSPADSMVLALVGPTLCGAGLLLLAASLSAVGKKMSFAGSELPPAGLVIRGPYLLIRHPIYTAYAISWIGGAIYSMSALAIVPAMIMICFYVVVARREEAAILRSSLGREYQAYKTRTAMFVPYLV